MSLSKEYDDHYKANSNKWTIVDRDKFALDVIKNHISEPKNVLEIGFGNGHFLELIAKNFPEANLTGLELSQVAINLASDKLENAKLIMKDFNEFTSRSKFDLIINLGSVEHIENLEPALENIKKLLRTDGICYFEAPDNLVYSPGDHGFRRLRIGSRQVEWHLTRNEWEIAFDKAGLNIVAGYYGLKLSWRNVWVLA